MLKNINFFSKDEKSEPKPTKPPKTQGEGLFRFLPGKGDKEEKTKDKKDKKRKEKEKKDGGILKGITGRFGGNSNETKTDEPVEEEVVVDTRPTFVQFQRPTKQTLPKSGTRSIPKDIKKSPTKSTKPATPPTRTTTSVQKPKPKQPTPKASPPKPQPKVKPSKTRKILDRVQGKTGDNEDGVSVLGRVQRLFASNSTKSTLAEEDKDKKKSKTSRTPRSVASKFVANMMANNNNPEEEWIPVCPKTRLSPGEIVPVEAAGLDLIVVASKDAQNIYAMVNSCPHLGTPLETGFLERRPIEADAGSSGNGGAFPAPNKELQESDVAALLASDGCEDCIVCPLHKTAFALQSGQVRGEWCPYPPVLGKMMSTVKQSTSAAVFDVRTRGKNIEVRLNTPLRSAEEEDEGDKKKKKKKSGDSF